MKAFCDYNEYEIAGEYEDAGKSGKSIEERIAFNQMMDDIKSGTKRRPSIWKRKKYEITIRSSVAEYLTYVASVGDQHDSIEMCYENENIWTQKMMAALYNVDVRTINEHIK